MSARGHVLFSIAMLIFAKKIKFTSILSEGYWGHIILGAILGCLLPDIDHPQSWIGQRFKLFSKIIFKIFGHRKFTHSIFFILICIILINYSSSFRLIFPLDLIHAVVYSYISHILADMLTPSGVPLFWPLQWRFRLPILYFIKSNIGEYVFCTILLLISILYPINMHLITKYLCFIYNFFLN